MVFVVDKNGSRLMPTNEYRARRLMKKEYASIRRQRTELKPGSLILFEDAVKTVYGTHSRFRKLRNGVVVKKVNV